MPKLTIAAAIKEIILKKEKNFIWFGHIDTWSEAHELARGTGVHPKDAWQSVRKALSSSKLFRQEGFIRAADWSGREILHPRYVLVEEAISEHVKI